MLRLAAIAIALFPVMLGVLLRAHEWGPWIGVGVAIAGGVAFTLARPRARALVLLGTLLAASAGLAAPQLPAVLDDDAVIDLRTRSAPPELAGAVEVIGFYREEWTLAEYAVPEGSLPQQDSRAEAMLVPLLGVEDGPVPLRDVIVVARVRPGQERAPGVQRVHGWAGPLDDELLSALVQASGLQAPPSVRGLLVDARDLPLAPAWLRASLVGLAAVGALVCLWLAAVGREPPLVGHPRRRAG